MSKAKSLMSAGITSLGTLFSAAVTAAGVSATAITAQKLLETGDYNASAIPLTAAFVTAGWAAITFVGAKASKNEWGSVFARENNQQDNQPTPNT